MRSNEEASPESAPNRSETDRLRELVQKGAEQLDRDEVVDGETFFREWEEELLEIESEERR